MTDSTETPHPAQDRALALWFALGTGLFAIGYSLGPALWAYAVSSLMAGTTQEQALDFPLVLGFLVLEFGATYGAVWLARHNAAPRWLWLPLSALSAWAGLWGLVRYAVMAVPAASSGSLADVSIPFLDFASSVFFALWPLLAIALPAILACLMTGDADEPLLGDFREQGRVFAATSLLILAVGLPLVAVTFGWLADVPTAPQKILAVPLTLGVLVWNLLLPGLVCWVGTKRFHLPRTIWIVVAAGTLASFLGAQTPGQWFQDPAAAVAALVGSVLLAVLTTGAAILGSWLGTRGPVAQGRPAV